MKKIETLTEYKELLRQNKANRTKMDTNCFLMSNAVEKLIDKGCLYAVEYSQGLIVFVDEGNYFNVYYFWESGIPLPDLKQDKPVLIEELNNKGTRDAYLEKFEPLLIQAGFSLFKHNLQVEANLKECEQELRNKFEEKKSRLEAQGFKLEPCTDDACMKDVVALWESALELTDIPQDHKVLNPEDKVFCIFDSENTLAAAKWWHHSGKTSEGRHVVTNKAFERRGLGSTIQLAWLVDALDNGVQRHMTWIADTNTPSLEMHKRAGFLCNGRTSKQYILK